MGFGRNSNHSVGKQRGIQRRCSVTKYSLEASAKARCELACEERRQFLERQESFGSGILTLSEDDEDDYDSDYDSDFDDDAEASVQMPMAA